MGPGQFITLNSVLVVHRKNLSGKLTHVCFLDCQYFDLISYVYLFIPLCVCRIKKFNEDILTLELSLFQGRDIESPSPPPGSLPHNFSHSLSCNSINSEGEFIPESDEVSYTPTPTPKTRAMHVQEVNIKDYLRVILCDQWTWCLCFLVFGYWWKVLFK